MNEDRLTANVVKKLLNESSGHISPEIEARLNLAIAKSLEIHTKKFGQNASAGKAGHAALGAWLANIADWFNRPAISIALSAVFVGAAALGVAQFGLNTYDARISETADLDAAILSDDLPPDAYLDKGFIHYATELQQKNSIPAEDSIEQWMDSLPADFTTSI